MRRLAHDWQRVNFLRLSSGPTLRLLLIFGVMLIFTITKARVKRGGIGHVYSLVFGVRDEADEHAIRFISPTKH